MSEKQQQHGAIPVTMVRSEPLAKPARFAIPLEGRMVDEGAYNVVLKCVVEGEYNLYNFQKFYVVGNFSVFLISVQHIPQRKFIGLKIMERIQYRHPLTWYFHTIRNLEMYNSN